MFLKFSLLTVLRFPQNHTMARVERDLKDQAPAPLPWVGLLTTRYSTRSFYPGPHPARPRTPPGTRHPQPHWAASSSAPPPPQRETSPDSQSKSSLFQHKNIPPCPITIHLCVVFLGFVFCCCLFV